MILKNKNNKNQLSTAYLAGLFDGEGNVFFRPTNMCFSIFNTNKDIILWVKQFLGYGNITTRFPKKLTNNKIGYNFKVQNALDGSKFMELLIPFLHIKLDDAKKGLQFCKKILARKEKYKIRDYKIITDLKSGMSYKQAAKKYKIKWKTISIIRVKYYKRNPQENTI